MDTRRSRTSATAARTSLRNSKLQFLTRDHTRVQQMIDAKMLTREQARNHPEGHLLSRAIGSREEVEVELSGPVPLKVGDALLLCSDGLSGSSPTNRSATR